MKWAIQIAILVSVLTWANLGFAHGSSEFCARSAALVARLSSDPSPRNATQPRIIHAKIETKLERIEGFTSRRQYRIDWHYEERGDSGNLVYQFVDGADTYSVQMRVARQSGETNDITLNLPRGLEDDLLDMNLLKAVLDTIYQRSELGDRYEIIINDPTIVEKLNQVVGDTYGRSGDIPYEPRRASTSSEDPFFMESFPWDTREDAFFPFTSKREGRSLLARINSDETIGALLGDALMTTEFGKAVQASGDWLAKVMLVENPKYKDQEIQKSEVDGEAVPVFPLQWRIIIESQW